MAHGKLRVRFSFEMAFYFIRVESNSCMIYDDFRSQSGVMVVLSLLGTTEVGHPLALETQYSCMMRVMGVPSFSLMIRTCCRTAG